MFERSIQMWRDIGQPHQDLAARNNLAASLYDAGRVEEADRVLEGLAATEGPEHPSILANMGILQAHRGRLSEAAKAFEAALVCPYHDPLDPGQRAEIRMRYAAVLRRIGQKQEAKRRNREADALLREAKASAFTDHRVDWRDLGGKSR
jgi:Flp pilus assembly protein TadD